MAGHGKGPLRIAIEDFFKTYVSDHFDAWMASRLEIAEEHLVDTYKAVFERIAPGVEFPKEIEQYLDFIFEPTHQGGMAALAGFGTQLGMSAASSLLAPLMRLMNYGMDRYLATARVDPSTAYPMSWRYPELGDRILDDLEDLGWPEHMKDVWEGMLRPRVSDGDLISLWRRGELSNTDMRTEFSARGWNEEGINSLVTLTDIIPNVGDLIRMAVREAFNPELVEKFQYGLDFPTGVVEFAEAQGLSEEWVKRYWYSHWELPSVSAGYAMYHRLRPGLTDNPFDEDDLDSLLKTADIPPYFRKRLIEISHPVYTRVDVRRMYQAGVLSGDEVLSAYKDLGYDDEKAQNLTDFAIQDASTAEKELTKSIIEQAYKRKTINRSEAESNLQSLGYSAAQADFILAIIDASLSADIQDDEIENTRYLFVENELDDSGVYTALGTLNLPSEQIAHLIGVWTLERRKKIVLPSRADLEGWYKRSIIDDSQLLEGLTKRKYKPEDIELYMLEIDQEVADTASQDAERAQREQERLNDATLKTTFQVAKAAVNVEIAQAKLQAADIKLALHDIEDADQISDAKLELLQIANYIAEERVLKAQIRLAEVE